jgi:seryl-tRNA synthetase
MGNDNDSEELKRDNETLKARRTEISIEIEVSKKALDKANYEIAKVSEDIKEATDRLEFKSTNHMQEIMYVEET